jgi:hypothetical protein
MVLKRVSLILQSACGGRFVAPLRVMLRFLRLLPDLSCNIGATRVELLTDQLRLAFFFKCVGLLRFRQYPCASVNSTSVCRHS